ncbi:MAG TPA: nuclear transport factor 2 family protein [Thermoleophilaceae bacterium]
MRKDHAANRGLPDEHRNASLLRHIFDAFARDDLDAIAARFARDVRWHTPGRNQLAGDYVGREAVLALVRRSSQLADESYRAEVEDIMTSERHATALFRATGSRGGRQLDLRHLALYAIADSAVHEVWIAPLDQEAFDAFWA